MPRGSCGNVLEIRCTHSEAGQTCGRFLGRLAGGVLQIYCPRCKMWHDVAVVDLVKATVAELPQPTSEKAQVFL